MTEEQYLHHDCPAAFGSIEEPCPYCKQWEEMGGMRALMQEESHA